MSTILCIDTASSRFALAVARDGQIVAASEEDGAQDHSRLLLASIDRVLGGDRRSPAEILVVRGPGSYAGLRVGIATARGLGLALGIPVTGIGTMEAVAAAADPGRFTVIHPAGRGDYAAQGFESGRAVGALRTITAAEMPGGTVGEGAAAFGGREVSPGERCRAALEWRLGSGGSGDGAPVEALYLREPNITLPRRKPTATPA
ncbi:MAG: tRNA (adenosine(37)-N6)-threonylcarbamoyltransferase complex dimerization subunit type 1 TsaB [Chloroflexi bacterium]|nr:tRNA (adenosine(37)-N6)-threonylcarbamoyltransferase complex dimerization subunit type 1 TsaB [Chloroflexota bacterium]